LIYFVCKIYVGSFLFIISTKVISAFVGIPNLIKFSEVISYIVKAPPLLVCSPAKVRGSTNNSLADSLRHLLINILLLSIAGIVVEILFCLPLRQKRLERIAL
jgi:hypothetical protein